LYQIGQMSSGLEQIASAREAISKQIDWAAIAFEKMLAAQLPPNWTSIEMPPDSLINTILMDEGLPLAWVPSAAILSDLFLAPDAESRLRIIDTNAVQILDDCDDLLHSIQSPVLLKYSHFALGAVHAMRDGHWESGQALCANLLDTYIGSEFDKSDQDILKTQTTLPDIDSYRFKLALVIGAVWGSHLNFRISSGDSVPTRFARNASVHAVSDAQYTRANAVVALMQVTSLFLLVEHES
jgi:hypothetical protein